MVAIAPGQCRTPRWRIATPRVPCDRNSWLVVGGASTGAASERRAPASMPQGGSPVPSSRPRRRTPSQGRDWARSQAPPATAGSPARQCAHAPGQPATSRAAYVGSSSLRRRTDTYGSASRKDQPGVSAITKHRSGVASRTSARCSRTARARRRGSAPPGMLQPRWRPVAALKPTGGDLPHRRCRRGPAATDFAAAAPGDRRQLGAGHRTSIVDTVADQLFLRAGVSAPHELLIRNSATAVQMTMTRQQVVSRRFQRRLLNPGLCRLAGSAPRQ